MCVSELGMCVCECPVNPSLVVASGDCWGNTLPLVQPCVLGTPCLCWAGLAPWPGVPSHACGPSVRSQGMLALGGAVLTTARRVCRPARRGRAHPGHSHQVLSGRCLLPSPPLGCWGSGERWLPARVRFSVLVPRARQRVPCSHCLPRGAAHSVLPQGMTPGLPCRMHTLARLPR